MAELNKSIIPAFTITLLVLCTIWGLLTYLPENRLRAGFEAIFTTFENSSRHILILTAVVISLALVVGLVWLGFVAYQSGLIWYFMGRLKRAEVLQAEREASLVITVAPPGSQVYASEVSGILPLIHKPLYLAAGNVNGKEIEPALTQVKRWSFFQLTQSINKPDKNIMENGWPQLQAPLPNYVDLTHYIQETTSLDNVFLGIGRFPDGRVEPVSRSLTVLVHVACGGSSGFGKSVFMQSLGYQAIHAKEECEPTFLDAQAVTFQVFSNDERLHYPVASEEKDIQAVLADLVGEMNRRKELYSQWRGVFSLTQYNRVADDKLPTLPIFFDEFGLLSSNKPLAKLVDKLAKGGRKFGLYLLASSQTWGHDEIATSLRANLSTTVQFYARDKSQSRVLLGDSAAAEITRPGQAYCRLPGQAGLIELQAPDVSNILDVTPMLLEAHQEMPTLPPDERTEQEQVILELHQAGSGINEIARQVYGSIGGKQSELIKRVIEKHQN